MTVSSLVVSALAIAAAVLFLTPALVDLRSLVKRMPRPGLRIKGRRARFLFLIPAHNEESMIASTVRSVASMNYPRSLVRIVVLADNCTDATALVARRAGAECLERFDAARRGKPHAMAWALDILAGGDHDAVVILDADAVVDRDYANALDQAGPLRDKAIECYDDVRNPDDSPMTRMAAVLAAGRFRGSFALKHRAGLTVPLSDGMCIGVDLLERHPWNAFGIAEDWEYYAQLTAAGERIELTADAHLYAQESSSLNQARVQRHRWLAGKLDALRRVGPELIRSRRISWHQKLDTLCELAVPGPAVQLGVTAVLATLVLLVARDRAALTLGLLGASLMRPIAWAIVGVMTLPDRLGTIASFTYLPIYTFWRLGVAASSVWPARSERPWVRTARG